MTENIPKLRFEGFNGPWEQRKLGTLLKTKGFKEYIKEPNLEGDYPVIQQGETPIAGLANGIPIQDFKNYILFGDHTLSLYKPKTPFFIASDGLKIIYNPNFDVNFLYVLLERYKPKSEGYKRHFLILKDSLGTYPADLLEQAHIGSFFSNFDQLITLHQRKLDSLKEKKKGYLQKLFPKDGEKYPELRFEGFTDPWEQRKLGEIATDIKDGTHGSHKDEAGSSFFLLSAKNIKEGKLFYSQEDRQISKKDFELINKSFSPQKNDILLTIVGSIGESTVLENPLNIAFQRSVAFIRTNNSIQPEFLNISLQTNTVQQYLEDHKSVSAQPGIYLSELEKLPILFPTLQEQTKIAKLFKLINTSITLHQYQLNLLKEKKKGYFQQMFPPI